MISLVPDQTPAAVDKLVRDFLEAEFALLGTKCKMDFEVMSSGKPWVADTDHWNYKAAIKATQVSEKNMNHSLSIPPSYNTSSPDLVNHFPPSFE